MDHYQGLNLSTKSEPDEGGAERTRGINGGVAEDCNQEDNPQ